MALKLFARSWHYGYAKKTYVSLFHPEKGNLLISLRVDEDGKLRIKDFLVGGQEADQAAKAAMEVLVSPPHPSMPNPVGEDMLLSMFQRFLEADWNLATTSKPEVIVEYFREKICVTGFLTRTWVKLVEAACKFQKENNK